MDFKKIVLITTGQPSCNPRIVKEADALSAAGHEVIMLYCFFINWATEKDILLLKEAAWKFKMIGGSPLKNKIQFLFTRIRNRFCRIINKWNIQDFFFAERTQARCYDELLTEAKKIKADWYIAHNLGALPVAAKAASYHNTKAGFDFEDYYRGEILGDDIINLKRISYLEEKYVPSLNYISAASPLILDAVLKDFPAINIYTITLNNCFPLKQQPVFRDKDPVNRTLSLFWFSQTIGINRGLEALIQALLKNNDPLVSLTFAGRCNTDIKDYIDQHAASIKNSLHFAGIIRPEELPTFASGFDVGMALELQEPYNRDICLTNKIFTYLLAGNAIILSETSMQAAFNEKYKIGESVASNDIKTLSEKINLYKNSVKLNAQRRYNYNLATDLFNWEKESGKLLTAINK